MYRIISVESDGTLKVIKNTSIGTATWDSTSIAYNTIKEGNTYEVSSNIYLAGHDVPVLPDDSNTCSIALIWESSSLAGYLNGSWYNNLINIFPNSYKNALVSSYSYGVGVILSTSSLATSITEENATKWTGKVGLMSVTDYIKASKNSSCSSISSYSSSGCYSSESTNNWLYLSNKQSTLSTVSTGVAYVTTSGITYSISEHCSASEIRPVLYLNSGIVISGSGTSGSPYKIISIQ